MGTWLIIQGTTVTGTALATMGFEDFNVLVITIIPLIFKINVAVACRTFWCVTHSAAATEVSLLYVTIRYVTRSSTLPYKTSTLTDYEANP